MAANEFEKNVQRTMDELKLPPSGEVWQKVKERIQEKKKKRRILFFIIFSFISLSLAGYGVYDFSVRQNMKSEARSLKLEEKGQGTRDKAQGTREKGQGTRNKERVTSNEQASINNSEKLSQTHRIKVRNQRTGFRSQTGSGDKNSEIKQTFSAVNLIKKRNHETDRGSSDTKSTTKNADTPINNQSESLKDTTHKENITKLAKKDIATNISADTAVRKNEENKKNGETVSVKKTKRKDQIFKNLKWGINFSAGASTIKQGRFSFKTPVYSDANFNTTPGTTGGPARYPPSQNKYAFAFKAGAIVKKNISGHSGLSMGLIYTYLADRVKTGTRQTNGQQSGYSSALFSYYSGTPQKIYTDRFHFIELPVMYDWRITKNSDRFLSLNFGGSASYLLATNALLYDTTLGGIYFHDKDLFTRTHINFASGISYHAGERKNFEWSIGPQFSFDLSRLIKTDIDKRKYFLYSGIDVRIFPGKKKKK